MKLIKIATAGLIFFGLSYIFILQLDSLLPSSNNVIVHASMDYNIIFSLIYGLTGLIAIILYRNLSLKGLIYIIIATLMLFVMEGFYIKWLSNYQISPNVISEIRLNFKTIYYFPIIPFGLIILSFGFKLIQLEKLLDKLPIISTQLKPNLKRLLAFSIDWLIVLVIGWILSSFMIILWFPVEIFLFMLIYRVSFEFSTNKTIGKRLFDLNVKQNDNSILKFKSIVMRNISRLILIYWIPIISGKPGIHDRISNTRIE